MFNPLALLSLREKVLGFVAWTLLVVFATVYTYGKFVDANELAIVRTQLEQSNRAPGAIIKFRQDLGKTNAKNDPCYSAKLPADVARLLQ